MLVQRRAFELGLDERRPRDVWRRLHFVLDQARQFTDAYGADLRRYLAWAELQSAEDARVVEAILPETDDDAVRIMTIHASKGLEFPVVVLAGLNTEYRVRGAGVDVLWGDAGMEVKLVKGLDTAGYAEVAEREQRIDQHEQLRLLYVAATRARDHLVVSLHHKAQTSIRCQAAELDRLAREPSPRWRRLEPVSAATRRPAPLPRTPAASAESGRLDPRSAMDDDGLEARRRWMAERAAALDRAARPATLAATRVARLAREQADRERGDRSDDTDRAVGDRTGRAGPDEAGPDEAVAEATPWRRGRAGTAIGRAVHGVLQRVDLATGADLAALAASQATAEGVADRADEVERLVAAALGSEIVRTAVAANRWWREVYVGAPGGRADPGGLRRPAHRRPRRPDRRRLQDRCRPRRRPRRSSATPTGCRAPPTPSPSKQALGRPVVRCVFLFLRSDGAAGAPGGRPGGRKGAGPGGAGSNLNHGDEPTGGPRHEPFGPFPGQRRRRNVFVMRRISNSFAMARASWRMLLSDKQLMVIPVLSFLCTMAVALLSGGAIYVSLHQVVGV